MAEKCDHCGRDVKNHSLLWSTTKDGYPNRPVEDGPEWGPYLLLTGKNEEISSVVCKACWGEGKKFKEKA